MENLLKIACVKLFIMSKVLVLGGPGGSGRTTIAEQIVEKTGLRRVYGGGIMRQIAIEVGYYDIDPFSGKKKFNEEKFVQFHSEYVKNHPEIDYEIEARLFKEAHLGNVLIESMTFACIAKRMELPFTKVWVTADEKERARRICEREEKYGNVFTIEEMIEITKKRMEENRKRYLALYGFDFLDVDKWYDVIFDTTNIPKDQMGNLLLKILREKGFDF